MRATRRSPGRLGAAGLLLAAILIAGATAAPAADVKPVGVIDSNRIVEEYDAARDAQAQYEKFLRDLEKEITEKEQELQSLAEEIESQKMLLAEEKLADKRQQFENLRADYLEFRKQVDSRAEAEYKEKIGPIIEQVRLIAERLGKEEGFGLIIDVASLTVLYLDDSVDLTDKVLAALVRGTDE